MAKATNNKAPKNVTKTGDDKGKVPTTKANLTRDERRERDKALKDKAKQEVLKSGFHFDDTIPASQFFQNYGSAVKRATLGPLHAKANEEPAEQTDAEKRLEAAGTDEMHVDEALVTESAEQDAAKNTKKVEDAGAAKTSTAELVAAAKQTLTGAALKAEEAVQRFEERNAANENVADEKLTTLAVKPVDGGIELVNAAVDPWLKREDETKAEWKARKKELAKAAAAKPVAEQAPNVMANPPTAPEALVKAMHSETRNGEPPTVADSKTKPPKGERYLTQEELEYWQSRKGLIPDFVPQDWSIAAHEQHVATVEAMMDKPNETKAADEPATTTEDPVAGETPEAPVPQPDDAGVTETPAAPDTPAVDPVDQPAEQEAPPVAEPTQPVEAVTKPELVVDNTTKIATPAGINHRGEENQAAAAKFYGAFYNKDNAADLNEAHYWLISAIKADEEGAESKFYMTLANSLKYEQYAFGDRTATSTVLIGKLKSESLFSNRATPRPSLGKAA